jgi:enoyl-CoA hydratase/carnithine racemase
MKMDDRPYVRVERSDSVSVVYLDRPPVNAIDLNFVRDADECFAGLESDGSARALILTGAGRCFSAGLDLRLVPRYDRDQQREMILGVNRMIRRLYSFPCPTIAAVNGHAIAGGLCVALACDYRIGIESPCELGLTEARAGIPFPAGPMAVVNAELVPHVARRLTLVARNMSPQEAVRDGILDELQAPERLLERAAEVARDLAQIPRDAYVRIKRQLRAATIRILDEIVQTGSDPMLDAWLAPEATASSAELLGGRAGKKRP